MASAPPELPQSIVLGTFNGIKNTVSAERLAITDLEAAVNVDLDDVGQLRRRRGFVRRKSTRHHSLFTLEDRTLVVREGTLGFLFPDYSFVGLAEVGDDPISYTAVASTIYCSSRSFSGKIVNNVLERWGSEDANGIWVSPVVTPTDTLGPIAGRNLTAPPHATELETYKGRIYLGAGRVLWATELYLYDLIDRTKNFIQTEHDITMVRAVGDGLYVGTTAQLLFLSGTLSDGLRQNVVANTGVIKGSSVVVPVSKAHPRARSAPIPEGEAPLFMTTGGICLGLDSGEVYNLTQDRTLFPAGTSAAALYREDQGANSYLAAVNSAGGPSANTRIGDYVDAEIIRASQRG